VIDLLKKQLNNKKDANVRERGLEAIRSIAQHSTISPAVEPYLVSLLPHVLRVWAYSVHGGRLPVPFPPGERRFYLADSP
jgi:hypothetical protein